MPVDTSLRAHDNNLRGWQQLKPLIDCLVISIVLPKAVSV
jgi:hypothetical protein